MKPKFLAEDEQEFIDKNIHQFSIAKIADMLGRRPEAIRNYARKKGLRSIKHFNKESFKNPYHLTAQEMVVWTLVSQGLSNEEIMEKLCITHSTLKTYLNNVYGNLGLCGKYKEHSMYRVQALLLYQKAVKEGLIDGTVQTLEL